MKKIIFAAFILGFSAAAQGVTLECQTTGALGETPNLSLVGQVSDEFAQGEEAGLTQIQDVSVTVGGKTVHLGNLEIDPTYKPRMENRVRFNTVGLRTKVAGDTFDGIVHGFIFPQIISGETFEAKVISSDDAYHDGIWAYYSMSCQVK